MEKRVFFVILLTSIIFISCRQERKLNLPEFKVNKIILTEKNDTLTIIEDEDKIIKILLFLGAGKKDERDDHFKGFHFLVLKMANETKLVGVMGNRFRFGTKYFIADINILSKIKEICECDFQTSL